MSKKGSKIKSPKQAQNLTQMIETIHYPVRIQASPFFTLFLAGIKPIGHI